MKIATGPTAECRISLTQFIARVVATPLDSPPGKARESSLKVCASALNHSPGTSPNFRSQRRGSVSIVTPHLLAKGLALSTARRYWLETILLIPIFASAWLSSLACLHPSSVSGASGDWPVVSQCRIKYALIIEFF